MYLFNKTVMHNTAISKVTCFGLRTGHHRTYLLFETCLKNHTIIHKLGKEISSL